VDEIAKMSLIEHLEELRYRLFVIVGFVFGFSLICFVFVDFLRGIILLPAHDLSLVYLSPPEAFLANLRLSFTAGLFFSLPIILYQILAFMLPGFYKEERKVLIPSFLAIGFLFYLGLVFSYFVVFPLAINFFLGFAGEKLVPMFTFQNYLGFFSRFHFAFSIVFQLPLVLLILGILGVVSYVSLARIRKYAVLIIIIVSAVLTPPDFFSQLLMVGPLYLLFEFGLILIRIIEKRRKQIQ